MYVQMRVSMFTCRSGSNVPSIFLFETGYPISLEGHHVGQAGCPGGSRDLPVPSSHFAIALMTDSDGWTWLPYVGSENGAPVPAPAKQALYHPSHLSSLRGLF